MQASMSYFTVLSSVQWLLSRCWWYGCYILRGSNTRCHILSYWFVYRRYFILKLIRN